MATIQISALAHSYAVGFWRKRPEAGAASAYAHIVTKWRRQNDCLELLVGLISPTGTSGWILETDIVDTRLTVQIGFQPEQPLVRLFSRARVELLHAIRSGGRTRRYVRPAQGWLQETCTLHSEESFCQANFAGAEEVSA